MECDVQQSLIFTALMILASVSMAQADVSREACAFGESTWELKEQIESDSEANPEKIWWEGEHLSLALPQRLGGLSSVEKKMILIAQDDGYSRRMTEQEAFADFSRADGYIQYFHHNSNGKLYAIVASYPGDNEYGVILEVQGDSYSREVSAIVGKVAVVGDGDLYECKVSK